MSRQMVVIRTGCMSCRENGVRCDPNEPECKSFESTSWKANREPVSYRGKGGKQQLVSSNGIGSPSSLCLVQSWRGTLRERQSLHFFTIVSAPELSGFFDRSFWQHMLLQTAQSDATIKHLIAAIGAAHEYILRRRAARLNGETDSLRSFSLRQCNKAISGLIKPADSMSAFNIQRLMLASVLFTCYEAMAGNRKAAIPHIVSSRKLLDQHEHKSEVGYNDGNTTRLPVELDSLRQLIVHYECQIGNAPDEEYTETVHTGLAKIRARRLSSISDARISLEMALSNLGAVVARLPICETRSEVDRIVKVKRAYAQYLMDWDAAFTEFLARDQEQIDETLMDGCRLLKMHQLSAYTLASLDHFKGTEAYRELSPHFSAITDLGEVIVRNLPNRKVGCAAQSGPFLTHTMGLSEPLYLVATRCLDMATAQKAKRLIGKLPLTEGVHSPWRISFIEKMVWATMGKRYFDEHFKDDQMRYGTNLKDLASAQPADLAACRIDAPARQSGKDRRG